jgi:hypothetical protein
LLWHYALHHVHRSRTDQSDPALVLEFDGPASPAMPLSTASTASLPEQLSVSSSSLPDAASTSVQEAQSRGVVQTASPASSLDVPAAASTSVQVAQSPDVVQTASSASCFGLMRSPQQLPTCPADQQMFQTPAKVPISLAEQQMFQTPAKFDSTQFDELTDDEHWGLSSDVGPFTFVGAQGKTLGAPISFYKDDTLTSDTVTGRIIGKSSGIVLRYVTENNGQIVATDVVSSARSETPLQPNTEPRHVELSSDDDDAGNIDAENPSAVYAAQNQGANGVASFTFELGDKESAPMAALWKLFNQPKYRGGFLARSLFCEATKEKDLKVLPVPWNGGTCLKSTIAEKRLQETEWNNWTDNDKVNEWVRKRVFSIISANPRPNLFVTWMGRTTPMANMDAPMIAVTESLRCRIAHLAVDPKAKLLISLIYGPKPERDDVEDHDLRVKQLWNEVAQTFVNSPSWVPYKDMAMSNEYADIDTTASPHGLGLDGPAVREIWQALRTEWSRLKTATTSKTGASLLATGLLYENVWKFFINGSKMHFAHKVSAMYCFELWDKTEKSSGLPQWCNRTLPAQAAMSAGVQSGGSMSLSTPSKSKPGKDDPPGDSPVTRLCGVVETLVQTHYSMADNSAKHYSSLESKLRALQAAKAALPETDSLIVDINTEIRETTMKLLTQSKQPPSN